MFEKRTRKQNNGYRNAFAEREEIKMNSNIEFAWSSFYPVWIKYCGVCDEFEMLKSKWAYLSEEDFTALPRINDTFERVDNMIHETNDLFKPMFDREKRDQIANFDPNLARQRTYDLQRRFTDIALYVGILKFVFFQRTVSTEIPHVISGLPLSPERTVGNEAVYMAADNVANRYKDSIRIDKELSWDGVVSFIYPIQTGYFGGFNRPSRYLKQFHVSLTEEGKNFLGSYLLLAHEISHSSHYKVHENEKMWPRWFEILWDDIFNEDQNMFGREVEGLRYDCNNCYLYHYLYSFIFGEAFYAHEFEQCVADLVAFLIGGPATCLALVDILNTTPIGRHMPIRPAFLKGFFSEKGESFCSNLLESELSEMRGNWASHIENLATVLRAPCIEREEDPRSICFDLFRTVGQFSGRIFGHNDDILFRDGQTQDLELPIDPSSPPDGVNSITSSLVKNKFHILPEVEERIRGKLQRRIVCLDEDPRNILHCYYILHREGKTPDYAVTLFSLAFSERAKKEGSK